MSLPVIGLELSCDETFVPQMQGALHVRQMAESYGVPVVLHTDHCAHSLLGWFDGMLEADEKHFKEHGVPLFSSHMLDLSEEPMAENLKICTEYLKRMSKMNQLLEVRSVLQQLIYFRLDLWLKSR